ncbi:hypothetical protein [Arthrobacter sp. GMC3]|uniref:hypothetical protein n=1 Tax=Arthrobacter sp. GMC3 TaxID=2058894 RepID=UPI000CE2E1F6|nr:hypothetical protein [Arthrobacter sp. GMC3]
MNIILNIAFALALLAIAANQVARTIAQVKETRSKSKQSAAMARMADEVGRKLAGGDMGITSAVDAAGNCLDPACPVHGKDKN